jgi:protoporphyrinogen IX oxidase
MANLYLWLKAFHIIAVIAWMAGLFYLPRLFVYHANTAPLSAMSEAFKVMEARLARIIMLPAAVLAWVLGLGLAYVTGQLQDPQVWFLIKFLAVVALTGFHVLLIRHLRGFADDQRHKSEGYYRALNEVPTVLMVIIVIMAVVKPF